MFFRRIEVLKRKYTCKFEGKCRSISQQQGLKCKGCRYQLCLEAGMTFEPHFLELKNEKDASMMNTLEIVTFLDSKRSKNSKKLYTDEDFSLQEILEVRRMHVKIKLTLLRNSVSMCSLFSGAMRCYLEKLDRITTTDGKEIYTDNLKSLLGLGQGSDDFLNRIRHSVVGKLIELKATVEECVLINIIVFCNPGESQDPFFKTEPFFVVGVFCESNDVSKLSIRSPVNSHSQSIVYYQQQKYTSILFQYCQVTYQRNGPARLNQLLSLCPIIKRNYEDIKYLTMVFKLAMNPPKKPEDLIKTEPVFKFKKLVEELV
ncbi:unnamed protein product [Caenorhabditis brenneri]